MVFSGIQFTLNREISRFNNRTDVTVSAKNTPGKVMVKGRLFEEPSFFVKILSLWRIWIFAMTISPGYLSILVVHNHLSTLILADFSSTIDGILLIVGM